MYTELINIVSESTISKLYRTIGGGIEPTVDMVRQFFLNDDGKINMMRIAELYLNNGDYVRFMEFLDAPMDDVSNMLTSDVISEATMMKIYQATGGNHPSIERIAKYYNSAYAIAQLDIQSCGEEERLSHFLQNHDDPVTKILLTILSRQSMSHVYRLTRKSTVNGIVHYFMNDDGSVNTSKFAQLGLPQGERIRFISFLETNKNA